MSVRVEHGDMREVLGRMVAEGVTVQSIVTDPPYGLAFMARKWDSPDNIAFRSGTWRLCYDLLPPGGHLLAFGGSRTFHRLVVAIEEAGFEIRDSLAWLAGSGFPKSRNVGKDLDANEARCACGSVRDMRDAGLQTAIQTEEDDGDILRVLLPQQDIRDAASPVRQQWTREKEPGEGFVGREQSGMEGRRNLPQPQGQLRERALRPLPAGAVEHGEGGRLRDGASAGNGALGGPASNTHGDGASHRPRAAEQRADQPGTVAGQSESQAGGAWPLCGRCDKPIIPDGLGTALKPAMELICLARKPLDGTVAQTVLKHGTGALNIDGCRIGSEGGGGNGLGSHFGQLGNTTPLVKHGDDAGGSVGRWPANVVTDGSDEVVSAFPETNGSGSVRGTEPSECHSGVYSGPHGRMPFEAHAGTGSAARFFYSSKADADDRLGSKHPTVKPVDLMRWLVRLVTPKGGTVLDPFAGSGTTGMACMAEGFDCIMVEAEAEYVADIRRRIAHVSGDDTPLFSTPTEAA